MGHTRFERTGFLLGQRHRDRGCRRRRADKSRYRASWPKNQSQYGLWVMLAATGTPILTVRLQLGTTVSARAASTSASSRRRPSSCSPSVVQPTWLPKPGTLQHVGPPGAPPIDESRSDASPCIYGRSRCRFLIANPPFEPAAQEPGVQRSEVTLIVIALFSSQFELE